MTRPDERDPFRALDAVEPPDQWDDILRRAEGEPEIELPGTAVGGRPGLRRALVAAVVAAILGIAGVVAVSAGSGGGPPQAVNADQGGPTTTGPQDPTTPDSVVTGPAGGGVTTPQGGSGGESSGGSGGGRGTGRGGSSGGSGNPDGSGGSAGGGSGSGSGASTTTSTTRPGAGGSTSTTEPTTTLPEPTTTAPATTTTEPGAGGEPPAALWGRAWTVTALRGSGGARPLGSDRALVLNASDGRVSILVCNLLAGPASLDGDRLSVSLGAHTATTCGEPRDGNEAVIEALLSSSPTVSISGGRLTLTAGALQLTASG